MASGKQHFVADMAINIATLPIVFLYPEYTVQYIAGTLIGTIFTPDIDNPSTTYSEMLIANVVTFTLQLLGRRKSQAKRDSKIVYRFNNALTASYGVLISHRSFLSHFPGIGTFTITLYLWALYYVYSKVVGEPYIPYDIMVMQNTIAMLLIVIHHTVHALMDGMMIIFFGKKAYVLGYPFYLLTTKLFPQGR